MLQLNALFERLVGLLHPWGEQPSRIQRYTEDDLPIWGDDQDWPQLEDLTPQPLYGRPRYTEADIATI